MKGRERVTCPQIDMFVGTYSSLSNFYQSSFELDGQEWETVEHYYQAQKTHDPDLREGIRRASKPGQAKRIGQTVPLRPDWEEIKIDVMAKALEAKFRANPRIRDDLISTFPYILLEGNNWGDCFWGIDIKTRIGHNVLGLLLMELRARFRVESLVEQIERERAYAE